MPAALGDAYATAALYKAQKAKDSSADDTALGRELVAVSRYIDRVCGRALGFNKDASAVARIYRMGRGTRLDIDDHAAITSVAIGNAYTGVYESALAATAFRLLPINAAAKPEPEPYRQVEFITTQPGFGALVKVTGTGGWAAVPSAIISACIELTALLRLESPRATSQVNEIGQVVSTSRAAREIVEGLTHTYQLHARAAI